MKVVTIASQKGGTGKTTTAWATACGLHQMGYKVLSIDLDGQGDLSRTLDLDQDKPTIYEVLTKRCAMNAAIQTCYAGDAVPGSDLMWVLDRELTDIKALESILAKVKGYDYAVIDCPPSLGTVTLMGLVSADIAVIPAQPGEYAEHGIKSLISTIGAVKDVNKRLEVGGVLLTRFNPRTKEHQATREAVQALSVRVLGAIPECSPIGRAQRERQDLFTAANKTKGAIAYAQYLVELL